ncbi:MAG: MFS transporter [Bacteroidales bacterium]|nr:MFS transporter [Bacteroidales bacterium]
MPRLFAKNTQYYKFCLYGFFKNLRFFEPFLILFFLEQGLSFLEIGILYSIREILINIFEIPSGIIADSFGRKKSLIFSFLFYILSFLIFFVAERYFIFLIAIVFYAIGDAFRTGTHKAIIFDYLKINNWNDQRADYYGHTRSWSQMGSAISAILAALIIFYSGNYRTIFVFSVIPSFIDLILISSYPSYLNGQNKSLSLKQIKKKILLTTKDFIFSFKNKEILRSVSNLSVFSGLHKSIKDYLQAIIQTLAITIPILFLFTEKQKSAILVGIMYSFIYLLTSLASRYSGRFKEKIKSSEKAMNITLLVGLVATILTGLFYHNTLYTIAIALFIVIYLIENIRNPIGVAHISSLYKDEILATALSANSQAKSLFAAIFAPALGFLADKFGIGIGLSALAIIILITTPFYFLKQKSNS